MNKLLALADRVEKLTGPDREVDAEIAHAIAWRWDGWVEGDVEIEARPLDYVLNRVLNSHNSIWRNLPAYTASIDHAMTLVPAEAAHHFVEQQKVFRRSADYSWARLSLVFDDGFSVGDEGRAATPALALVAAALRARAHGGGEG